MIKLVIKQISNEDIYKYMYYFLSYKVIMMKEYLRSHSYQNISHQRNSINQHNFR